MFEIFNSVREMVLIFKDRRLAFANEAAQYYFNSYEYSLVGADISAFIESESLNEISENLQWKIDFSSDVVLSDGVSCKFDIKFINDDDGEEYLLIRATSEDLNKNLSDSIQRAVAPKALYDPLMLGKAEIYNCEIANCASNAECCLHTLSDSAIIRHNRELFEAVKNLQQYLKIILDKSRFYINELSSIEGKYMLTKNLFDLSDLLTGIVKKISNYLKIENYNIQINYTARNDEVMICADYVRVTKAVTGLISNSIRYIIASGRTGRIDITLKVNNGYAVIVVKDNGIGLSEEVFSTLNESPEKLYVQPENNRKEYINLQTIEFWVEQNNGKLFVNNESQKGSTAEIRLPLLSTSYSIVK